ncbi:MAG: VTT domain-containing protein [Candidatus Izimaplasma sp.]|nr:VTT domain-containing protein [Candidatus Izimaplasma bacterium]
MDFFNEWLEALRILVQENIWIAPLVGLLLPFLEAIFPTLPLAIIISFNLSVFGSAFGLVNGTILTIILSIIGSFVGMFLIFILIRLTFANYFIKKVRKYKYGTTFLNAVEGKSKWFVLALMSNPFMPSSILNYGLALTKVSIKKYILLTTVSRMIIILFMVFLGSIFNLQDNLLNVVWMMTAYFIILGIWVLYLRSRRNKKGSFFEDNE